MSEIIIYCSQNFKRTIDYDLQFILIGNNIDGFINVDLITFIDFTELKAKMPSILINIEHSGEWDLKLYQVCNSFQIIKKY